MNIVHYKTKLYVRIAFSLWAQWNLLWATEDTMVVASRSKGFSSLTLQPLLKIIECFITEPWISQMYFFFFCSESKLFSARIRVTLLGVSNIFWLLLLLPFPQEFLKDSYCPFICKRKGLVANKDFLCPMEEGFLLDHHIHVQRISPTDVALGWAGQEASSGQDEEDRSLSGQKHPTQKLSFF